MKKKITSILILTLILIFSCGEEKSESKKWTESDLNCGKAFVTEILGYNSYFGGGKDITVKCNVEFDKTAFQSELIIDVSFVGEAYCPFKVGDSVIAKFLKTNGKIAELYYFKRYNHRENYWMDTPFTFTEICENGKEFKQKGTYSRGKIID